MGQLGALLAAMHASGRPGFTISALNHVFHPLADVEQTKAVLRVWRDYADATLVLLAETAGTVDVLTLDRRGFSAYRTRKGRAFRPVP